jgi:Putative restriction endonuclease
MVSGIPVFWDERAVTWLHDSFSEVRQARGWACSGNSALVLKVGELAIIPDLQIFKDPDKIPQLQSEIPVEHVLLVAEVTSKDSKRIDREVKPAACAKAGIPFYLLVDRFVEPVTITLFSKPGRKGYSDTDAVPAGSSGGKLHIPLPFDITLDTTTTPLP